MLHSVSACLLNEHDFDHASILMFSWSVTIRVSGVHSFKRVMELYVRPIHA